MEYLKGMTSTSGSLAVVPVPLAKAVDVGLAAYLANRYSQGSMAMKATYAGLVYWVYKLVLPA